MAPRISCTYNTNMESNVKAAEGMGMLGFHYRFNDLELKDYCRALGYNFPEWKNIPSSLAC